MKNVDREGPPDVSPIDLGGVRYEAIHDGRSRGLEQDGGYIAATDPETRRVLWTLRVYSNARDPRREGDVQDVFITAVSPGASDGTLEVRNEDGDRFVVDLETRAVAPA